MTAKALAPPGISQGCDAEQCPGNLGEPTENSPLRWLLCLSQLQASLLFAFEFAARKSVFFFFFLSRYALVMVDVSATS